MRFKKYKLGARERKEEQEKMKNPEAERSAT
jgi:hypothetical protein